MSIKSAVEMAAELAEGLPRMELELAAERIVSGEPLSRADRRHIQALIDDCVSAIRDHGFDYYADKLAAAMGEDCRYEGCADE